MIVPDWPTNDNNNADANAGTDAGTVITRVRITNISASPVTVHIFRYVDMDVQVTTNGVTGTNNRHIVDNASIDDGTLNGWSLDASCDPPGGPTLP